jgi:hypothetical protein
MKTKNVNLNDLCNKLRSMKLSGMADSLEKQIKDPNNDLRSASDRIAEIITAE